MTKIKAVLTVVGGVAIVVIALVVWVGYNELKTLRIENYKLSQSMDQLNIVIDNERVRAGKIEEATIRLEDKDNVRQQQMQRFSASLNNLAKENESYRTILETIVPDDLVQGLKAFAR